MSKLELRGVSKSFGSNLVLDNISLEVAEGELLVVLGPSGCGKTTLLRVIAGLEDIDSGEIAIDGRRVDQFPPGKREVAMVFQSYALYPHMTVRENLAFGLRNAGIAKSEISRRITEVADILEISPLLERKPAQLSGGQRQRVAIGRAIVKEPKLFMFDEPLSSLDAALRNRTRQEIAALHRRLKAPMIFVTHDQAEAMTLADKIVIMNQNTIEQVGSPATIYNRPATTFVASFVGFPAMNVIPAAGVADDTGILRVVLGDGTQLRTSAARSGNSKGDALRVGFRPEDVQICAPGEGDTNASVQSSEYLGDRMHVNISLVCGDSIVALAGGAARFAVDESVGIKFNHEAAHVFGADGRRTPRDPGMPPIGGNG